MVPPRWTNDEPSMIRGNIDVDGRAQALYRARFSGHKFDLSGVLHVGLLPGNEFGAVRSPFFFNQPLGIVEFDELPHGSAEVVHGEFVNPRTNGSIRLLRYRHTMTQWLRRSIDLQRNRSTLYKLS